MIMTIDTAGKDFIVTKAPAPKLDQLGQPRKDRETGESLWTTQIVVTDESGGEVISVTTAGRPGDLDAGHSVEVSGLVAIPWSSNGRTGVSYRARSVKLIDLREM